MTAEQRQTLREELPQYASKIKTIGEFARTDEDVQDPYYGTSREYERVAGQMEELVCMVLDRLK
jgi:protein-tyrosine-phosphatase